MGWLKGIAELRLHKSGAPKKGYDA